MGLDARAPAEHIHGLITKQRKEQTMSAKSPKSVEKMQAERRELDRRIRAAKRAEKKAAEEALLSERQALGVWLAESVGADTIEDVQTLRTEVESGQVHHLLRNALGAQSSDTEPAASAAAGGDHHGSA